MTSLVLQEMSEQRPPAGWIRIAYGDVEYYCNETLHFTIDILQPLEGAVRSPPPFPGKPDLDIHMPSRRSEEVLYVDHDNRVAFWRQWLDSESTPAPPMAHAPCTHEAKGRPQSRSSSARTTLHNGSGVLPSTDVELASPPADATCIAVHDKGTSALEKQILYWDYVRGHPGHVDVGPFAQAVRDHLLWTRDQRALSLSADPAFSLDECEKFLRYLDAAPPPPESMQDKARQTRLIAALMKRVLKSERERRGRRQAFEEATNAKNLKPAETWLRWILYLVLIQVIFLGQPNTYSRRLARFKRGKPLSLDIHTKYWQAFLGAFIKEWNDTNLLATVMISATVGFLAVPGLDSISRILGIVAIITAIGSGLVGMLYVWHHGPRANTNALVGRAYIEKGKSVFGIRSSLLFACVLAVPVVLLWWSFLSFIAAVLVYAFRGQFLDAKGTPQDFSMATKYVALVAFVLVLDCGAVGYIFMWRVWQPINEPWAASTGDTRPDNAGPSEPD